MKKKLRRLKFLEVANEIEACSDDVITSLGHVNKSTNRGGVVTGMEEWEELNVPDSLIRGLYDQGFKVPTPIQKQAIAMTMETKGDIIGAAETVSTNF